MQVIDVFGRRVHFTLREMFLMFRRPEMLGYLALSFVVLAVLGRANFEGAPSGLDATLIFALGMAIYVAAYVALIVLATRVNDNNRFPVYLPVFSLVSVLSATAVAYATVNLIPSIEYSGFRIWAWLLVHNVVAAQIFEAIYFLFVLPYLLDRIRAGGHRTGAMILGGRSVAFADVQTVEADEHYVRITTPSGTAYGRARFADVVERLGGDAGFVIHRSVWVSAGAIQAVDRTGPPACVAIVDGRRFAVARGRRDDFRCWLERTCPGTPVQPMGVKASGGSGG